MFFVEKQCQNISTINKQKVTTEWSEPSLKSQPVLNLKAIAILRESSRGSFNTRTELITGTSLKPNAIPSFLSPLP